MAQFYAVTPVTYVGNHVRPGTLLDSTNDAAVYNAYVAAGGYATAASGTNVLAAAVLAASGVSKGMSDSELQTIMLAGVDLDQAATDVALAAAGAVVTAAKVQSRTVTILHGAMTATPDTDGTAFVANVGAALPAGAVVIAHEVEVTTVFSGGGLASMTLDVGGTTTNAIVAAMNVFTGAATGKLTPYTGAHAEGLFSAQQLVATVTPDGATKTSEPTAGSVTITIWFCVPS